LKRIIVNAKKFSNSSFNIKTLKNYK